jgi:hypothetical protein
VATASASPGGTAAAPSTPGATASPAGFACAPVAGIVSAASGLSRVTEVTTGNHEDQGYDRFTIRLSSAPTSFRVVPQGSAVLTMDPSGTSVTLEGSAGVRISLQGVAGTPAYAGPTDLRPGLVLLRETRQLGSFEGVVTWGLGLSRPGCLRVQAPTGAPATMVVDVSTR